MTSPEDRSPSAEPAPALHLTVQLACMKLHVCPDRGKLRRWVRRALGVLADDVARTRSKREAARTRTLRQQLAEPANLVLRFVGEAEGRALNQAFRQSDHATNVLTFPYTQDVGIHADISAKPRAKPRAKPGVNIKANIKANINSGISADIVLCAPVVEREAAEQGKTLNAHYAHLVIHGVLHAAGLKHDSDDEARVMEELERKVLAAFRISDPYSTSLSRDGTGTNVTSP